MDSSGIIGTDNNEDKIDKGGRVPGLTMMHVYRDAIVCSDGGPAVWGAFALAPVKIEGKGRFTPCSLAWMRKHRFGAVEMRPKTKERALQEIAELVGEWRKQQ
jgi:hypothetical protein